MEFLDSVVMIFIYFVLTIGIFAFEMREIKKNNKLMFHNYINFFLILFYCIAPPINIYYKYLAKIKTKFANYLTEDVKFYYFTILITLVTYICLRIGYAINIKFKHKEKKEKMIKIDSKNFKLAAIVLCVIGWAAIIFWTKVYGKPWDIFPYASQIRSGIIKIHNPYTFMKPFCPIVVVATYCFFLILLETKTKNKFLYFVFMTVSAFGSVIYFIGNDGRLMIILFFLTPILYLLFRNKEKINYTKIAVIGIFTLVFLGNLDNITYYFRNNEQREEKATTSIVEVISEELTFAHMNIVNSLYMREQQIITEYTFLQDVKNVFFAWVPERFKPDSIVTLYELNTSKYPNSSGTLPTDLITAGIFKFGSGLFFILPILVGIMIRIIENLFEKKKDCFNKIMAILLAVYLGLKVNGYYDLSCILFGVFYIVIAYIVINIFNRFNMEEI